MGVAFTKEQQQVIELRNRNILVSAAAGSGKTAVLVERIITRLTKDQPPLDVDELLIVTYTEAAAAEMKERIRDAIEKALEKDPENEHLQRQATLVHHAQVTTIHSFCLSVIREYFHTIQLDPGFRIAEEGELKLLKQDVLERVLESYYEEASPAFLDFVECFAPGKDDKKIEEMVLQLFEYSRSYPDPEAWMDSCVKQYEYESSEELEKSYFAGLILESVNQTLKDVKENLDYGMKVCQEEEGPLAYLETLEADWLQIEKLVACANFTELYEALTELKWARLATNRDKSVSEEKQELVKSLRDEYKKTVKTLTEQYFYAPLERIRDDLHDARDNMVVFVQLVKEFQTAFQTEKKNKNLIDFGDMEHYALEILTRKEDGKLVPSQVAREYQGVFREIMIDEYQDSNLIQEAILTSVSTVSEGNNNIFMVGDVKQSIYRFRLSRPELFMQKYRTYDTEDSKTQRIDLFQNFRSRREVLDSTNFLFEQIMTEGFGGIRYDEKAALYVGASYEEKPGNETELCLVDASLTIDGEERKELEAHAVCKRILELVGTHEVFDKKTGMYRKATYGDIVILTRSLKGWTDVFLRVMEGEGIPAYSASKEGYFETREIQILLDYLRILDNPRQDIPLAAVLTSPFAGLTGEELAKIKIETTEGDFYERVKAYGEIGTDAHLKQRILAFFETYESFRSKVPYTAIHKLLWAIMDDTGYGNYILALPGGKQRHANLDMLVQKAIQFESTSYKGLFHFVRYIEQLHKYDVDYGEASLLNESADVVRIMSIHKSKGLEFPIVFAVGMEKQFNMQDVRKSIVIHPELGVGMDVFDLERRTKAKTLLKQVIQKQVQNESVAEELRVLYVAMTRAKEKMILVGAVTDMEQMLNGCKNLTSRETVELPYTRLTRAKSYLDWIVPALYRNQCMADLLIQFEMPVPFMNSLYRRKTPICVRWMEEADVYGVEPKRTLEEIWTRQILENWKTDHVYDMEMHKKIEEEFGYQYPYETDLKKKQKVSVSELKKQVYLEAEELEPEEEIIPLLPKFLKEEETMTGANRGTAYHRVMELLDVSVTYEDEKLQAAIGNMVRDGLIGELEAGCVRTRDIMRFLQSNVGTRVKKASQLKKLWTEQPFVLGVPDGDEVTLVQGIIDVYFEEEDELVVLDYKTDRVQSERELVDHYQIQLDYYAKALEQLTGKRVKQKIIYSFTLGKEIEV